MFGSRLVDSSTGTNRFAKIVPTASPALFFPLAPLLFSNFLASVCLITSSVLPLTVPANSRSSLPHLFAWHWAKQSRDPCTPQQSDPIHCYCSLTSSERVLVAVWLQWYSAGSHWCLLRPRQKDEPASAGSLRGCCSGRRAGFSLCSLGSQSWFAPGDVLDAGISLAIGCLFPREQLLIAWQ